MKEVNQHIHSIRKDYDSHSLEEQNISPSPFVQFGGWMQDAIGAGVPEPNAITLSTVTVSGRPTSRIVLLREFSEAGFIFYTNYSSKKGNNIDRNPCVCLNLFWPALERQVRIEGVAEKVASGKSDEYFRSRPIDSQLGAWASLQSQVLKSRNELESSMKDLHRKYEGGEIPRPSHWGGYAVKPDYFEFWQGRPNRLHDRICYSLHEDGRWVTERLFP